MIYEPFYKELRLRLELSREVETFSDGAGLTAKVECLISLGGDGTLLDTVTFVRDKDIPVLGVNFGRLGFLATTGREDIHQLVRALVARSYVVDERSLIHRMPVCPCSATCLMP
ncbi:NAD(+)/NADH kinase [Chitinophaga sedimenti]|uniref:NAD(+)/NADH kinase n=1 Tax=Chitinophaga sedimenti TaxID=2033606 RepID=UPI0020040736|nr:NAD(+)/NADH kinase [Chitinophaga sedimenti]MCK7558158.1 NAD(+)/NADH kinase [Chitinophaga sedimenti]